MQVFADQAFPNGLAAPGMAVASWAGSPPPSTAGGDNITVILSADGSDMRATAFLRCHRSPVANAVIEAQCCTPDNIALFDERLRCLEKPSDTVGEPQSMVFQQLS
jgi:hypothetical protein